MKKFITFGNLFILNILLTVNAICFYLDCQKDSKNLVKFSKKQQKLTKLQHENASLIFPWTDFRSDRKEDIQTKFKTLLSKADFLQKDFEIYQSSCQETRKYARPQLSYQSSFFSGFLLHSDCLDFLKLIVKFDGPIWIHSLTLQRNHFDNYGFQISMIYMLGALKQ